MTDAETQIRDANLTIGLLRIELSQQEERVRELEAKYEPYEKGCLLCGQAEPCLSGTDSPCTFNYSYAQLVTMTQRYRDKVLNLEQTVTVLNLQVQTHAVAVMERETRSVMTSQEECKEAWKTLCGENKPVLKIGDTCPTCGEKTPCSHLHCDYFCPVCSMSPCQCDEEEEV